MTYIDASVAQKLINETTHTKISGRKVDLRKAELKTSDKIAILNKSSGGGAGEGQRANHSSQMTSGTDGGNRNSQQQ